ncbi:hypothetical protein At1D132_48850 (plasmid) [Agrobacterium fabrum]|nr:hypothetical protein At1D132_48850 [Agrobacterium fabrum]
METRVRGRPERISDIRILGFKASTVGRFAIVVLLILAAGLAVLALGYGPTQVTQALRGKLEPTASMK